jgi:predicted amidohydrolase YtcJ
VEADSTIWISSGVRAYSAYTSWSVAPLNPILGLYAAITRVTLDGKNPNGWIPEEKITLPEAVEAYTMGSAFAEFQEKEKGSITPGKLADMVILSDNIFDLKPEAIRGRKSLSGPGEGGVGNTVASETTMTVGWIAERLELGSLGYLNHLLNRQRKSGGK